MTKTRHIGLMTVLAASLATGAIADVFGFDTVFGNAQDDIHRTQIATQVTLAEDQTIGSITAYVGGKKSQDVGYAIYADDGGEPGALIVESVVDTQSTDDFEWFTLDIEDTALTAGTYWLALCVKHKWQSYDYAAAGGQTRVVDHWATKDGFLADWGASDSSSTRRIAIYGIPAAGETILFIVRASGSLTAQESLRRTQLESWGYTVNAVWAGESQAFIDAAAATAQVAYVSEEVVAGDLGTKLSGASIGVVTSEQELCDELGFASSFGNTTADAIVVTDVAHYITQTLAAGPVTVTSSAQALVALTGTVGSGVETLAEHADGRRALSVLDPGDGMHGGGAAAGRRVYLPWGGSSFDFASLSADGLTILQRSLEWAGGTGAASAGGATPRVVRWQEIEPGS